MNLEVISSGKRYRVTWYQRDGLDMDFDQYPKKLKPSQFPLRPDWKPKIVRWDLLRGIWHKHEKISSSQTFNIVPASVVMELYDMTVYLVDDNHDR